ncbi:MAG: nucleoside recognition domain-containing protein [Candidatus Poribacteria bacterium]
MGGNRQHCHPGEYGGRYVAIVFGTLALIWALLGFTLNKIMKGLSPELLLEIPSYHLPRIAPLSKKLWMRLAGFLEDAIPFMLLGILLMNILFATGAIKWVAKALAPVITNLMGLPASVVVALIMGFLRKDIAVGMLAPLGLTAKQLTIASTVLAVYFPCIAAFVVLLKELGIKDMLKSALCEINPGLRFECIHSSELRIITCGYINVKVHDVKDFCVAEGQELFLRQ